MSNENVDKGADSSPKVSKIESDLPLYFAKTLAGMEQLLVSELVDLGAIAVKDVRRGVEFKADMSTLFRVCLSSRFALTVLRPILSFNAQNPDELYEEAKKWEWGAVMTAHSSFAIDVTVHSFTPPIYESPHYIPGLSALDLVMHHGPGSSALLGV